MARPASMARRSNHNRGEPACRVTYPPLDVPKAVADNLWIVDSGPMHVYGLPMPIRMTVIRLENGDLVLHSPTRYRPHLHEALERQGRIRHLVAPNVVHWTFAASWQQAVPDSLLWAAPGVANRRVAKRSGLRIDREMDGNAPPEWRCEIDQTVIAGRGFSEIALFHHQTRTLILTDTVVNLEPAKLPRAMAWLVRLAGAAAPHGGAPHYLRALILANRRRAADAVARLLALEPQRVIFAHGAWFETEGAKRLRRSFRWLLGPEHLPITPRKS